MSDTRIMPMGEGGVKVIAGPGKKISNMKRQQDNDSKRVLALLH